MKTKNTYRPLNQQMQTAPSTNEFLIPKKADCYESTRIVFESKYEPVNCNMISVLTPHQTSTRLPNHNYSTETSIDECKWLRCRHSQKGESSQKAEKKKDVLVSFLTTVLWSWAFDIQCLKRNMIAIYQKNNHKEIFTNNNTEH